MKLRMRLFWFLLLIAFAACKNKDKEANLQVLAAEDIYTCSMHPQVLEKHPGNCPICGMQLIKKNQPPAGISNIPLESVLKPTNGFVLASLAVITPEQKRIDIPVRAYGTIEYDTRAAGIISARLSGRIEKLYVRYRYQPISKGQKIMDIYSPEILTAEQNLLFLLQNDAGNSAFIQAAKEKLLLLGMSTVQLNQIIQNGKPSYSITIYSNYDGHVHDAGMSKNGLENSAMNSNAVLTQELPIKEGMYVQKGQTLFMIMNHHMVWAALQIFTADQSLVRIGNKVNLFPDADTSAVIKGRVDLIEPFFRTNNNTLTARVYFENNYMLPIGSHVSANIFSNSQANLWLPRSAVVSLGIHKIVFKKSTDGFVAHKIIAGISSDNEIQILSGLNERDSVAANGQYFIDSESFIVSSSN